MLCTWGATGVATRYKDCDEWRVSGKVIIWVRMWVVIQSPHASRFGGAAGRQIGTIWYMMPCFLSRVVGADPWATWFPDVRSHSNSQRSPDHSYTCWYQWTPATTTSDVAATNDVPTWHPPRKLYIARSLTKGDGEGFNFLQTSFGPDGDVSVSSICKPGQNGPRRHGT